MRDAGLRALLVEKTVQRWDDLKTSVLGRILFWRAKHLAWGTGLVGGLDMPVDVIDLPRVAKLPRKRTKGKPHASDVSDGAAKDGATLSLFTDDASVFLAANYLRAITDESSPFR